MASYVNESLFVSFCKSKRPTCMLCLNGLGVSKKGVGAMQIEVSQACFSNYHLRVKL